MKTISQLGLLSAFLAMLAFSTLVQAQDYTYTTNGDSTITITKYIGFGGNVTITNTINDLPVTSIGSSAFKDCTSLTGVTIPNGVTSIGDNAFDSCTKLTGITIPDSVTSIGSETFYRCPRLTSVTIGNGVTSIGNSAFYSCTKLTGITIPDSVTNIGISTFYNCTSLTAVVIGTGITSIGDWVFVSCTKLTGITIPDSVTSIGVQAFYCSGLTNITIPRNVTNVGMYAFKLCPKLTAITVNSSNLVYSSVDGVLFDISQTTLIQCPGDKAGTYAVPNSVVNIGDSAFYGCSSLTNVRVGSRTSSIGEYAFTSCTNLVSVTISDSVTDIGNYAFSCCTGLLAVYFCGDTPRASFTTVFALDYGVTVYYLPDTFGWDICDFRPTVLWNPQVLSDATFGIGPSGFGFTFTNAGSPTIVVQACTNLLDPVWSPLSTNTLTGGSSYFSDPQWTNDPARFYRFRAP
jgi:hypothetical protein